MESIQKLVVDTDCGVDDAQALLLAFSSERCQVLAVTCSYGNTTLDNVCENVKRVVFLCKQKLVPIHRGCRGPLLPREVRRVFNCHADDGLGNCAHEFSTGDLPESEIPAAVAMVQLAKDHPGEIILVALGPLTNVALAHHIDPHFTSRLKSIVCMGGNYKGIGNITEVAEFNFYCDPESADIVLGEASCPISLVPWETTFEFGIPMSTYEIMTQVLTEKGHFFKQITRILLELTLARNRTICVDCDFLAVATALYPESVRSTIEYPLAVECSGTYSRGLTLLLRTENDTSINSRRNKVKIVTGFDGTLLDTLRLQMLQDK